MRERVSASNAFKEWRWPVASFVSVGWTMSVLVQFTKYTEKVENSEIRGSFVKFSVFARNTFFRVFLSFRFVILFNPCKSHEI